MKFWFTDWRELDQSSVGLTFNKNYIHCVHARAWALKGWLGGTHSWHVFWSEQHNKWLTVELTDRETINIQKANILWIRDNVGYSELGPIISDRVPDGKWFGATPCIVGKAIKTFDFGDVVWACNNYPIAKSNVIKYNCNTFSSYLINQLDISIKMPLRSIGSKNKKFWNEYL